MNLAEKWKAEYQKQGIPSSYRKKPSGAVLKFFSYLSNKKLKPGKLIDLGCGKGRNSFFFAAKGFDVTSVDIVKDNIDEINNSTFAEKYLINAVVSDVTKKLPFDDNSFDFAIDTFCFKHQTKRESIENYINELSRVLKPNAYFLLTLAAIDDGFYGSLVDKHSNSKVIVDPFTDISSLLYDEREVVYEFEKLFAIKNYSKDIKDGEMHGGIYKRSTLVFYMQKK